MSYDIATKIYTGRYNFYRINLLMNNIIPLTNGIIQLMNGWGPSQGPRVAASHRQPTHWRPQGPGRAPAIN